MYTLEEVRADLLRICDENPDAKGRVDDAHARGCYYLVDADGQPVHDRTETETDIANTKPCCIVGRWFFLHPELLAREDVRGYLFANASLVFDDWPATLEVVTDAAAELLAAAQTKQDGSSTKGSPTFGELRHDIATFATSLSDDIVP